MNENKQVFRKTAETLVAEKRLLEWLKVNRWGLEKEIPEKMFNTFLNEVSPEKRVACLQSGIPYYFLGVEFKLVRKCKKTESV